MIRIAILGSTGSIGRSALEVVHRHPDQFKVASLVAETSADALAAQVASFNPRLAVLADEKIPLPDGDRMTTWASGSGAVLEAATDPETDVVLNALVGAAGLEPTLAALEAGHRLALAVYNAANEIAVQAFLESTIRFPEMADLVSGTIDRIGNSAVTGVEDVLEIDRSARLVATEVAHRLGKARVGVAQ